MYAFSSSRILKTFHAFGDNDANPGKWPELVDPAGLRAAAGAFRADGLGPGE